jgi:hypothetical protein
MQSAVEVKNGKKTIDQAIAEIADFQRPERIKDFVDGV